MANKTGMIRLLAWFIIASSSIALSNADVFSSAYKMASLVKTRQKVIDDLDAYIHKEEDRIRDLKRRINEYRVEQQNSLENVESYVANPVNAYILIKRLTVDLDHIKKLSKNTEFISNLSENNNKNETILYPTSVDLSGAAKGLLRLQRMYKMTVEDVANGVIGGTIYDSDKRNISIGLAMSASDCHHIGVNIFKTKNYLNSLPWHMEALKRFKSPDNKDDSITEIAILEYIGITYHHLGDMRSATDWTLKILAIDPDNVRAQTNICVYEDKEYGYLHLAKPSTDEKPNTKTSVDTDKAGNDDDKLNTRELPITKDSTDDKNETNQSDDSVNDNDTNEQGKNTADNIKGTVESEGNMKNATHTGSTKEGKKATHTENTTEGKNATHTESTKEGKNATHTENTNEGKNATHTENTKEGKNATQIKSKKEAIRRGKVEFRKEMAMYEALCRGEFNVDPEIASRLHCRYIHDAPFLKIAPIKAEHWFFQPDVMLFHDVISDAEIEHVKQLGSNSLKRAQVGSADKNASVVTEYRISQNSWLSDQQSPIIDRISARIEDFTGLNLEWAEDLQLGNYGIAGHYQPHYDWVGRVADNFEPVDRDRIATVMFYLSDVAQGGATVFPKLGLNVFPKKGSAIFWINLLSSGEGDRATRHAACPVLEGSKWVANKWITLKGNEFVRPCGLKYQSENDPLRHLPAPVPKPEVVDPVIVRYKNYRVTH